MPTRAKSSTRRSALEVQPLEPSKIFAEIEAQPPLMRTEATQAYLGKEVDWPATLADAREQRPGEIHVVCWSKSRDGGLIVGDVPFSRYPQLKAIRVGDSLQMRGRIKDIDTLRIELDITNLLLPQPATTHS